MEIERKFLLKENLKDKVEILSIQNINQGYYIFDNRKEVRLRSTSDIDSGITKYYLTFKEKTGSKLAREEIEMEISKDNFLELTKNMKLLKKIRNNIRTAINGEPTEVTIDIYYEDGFSSVCEIEFDSIDSANAFIPPDWFGSEVTSLYAYSNRELWKSIQDEE